MKYCPNTTMFYVKNPASLNKPWVLSKSVDSNQIVLPLDVTKCLNNYHLMGVEFLYHNYRKRLQGSILNVAEGMNFQLQIAAFLRAVANETSCFVLIICPSASLSYWHFHLANHGKFEVTKLDAKNVKDSFDGAKVAFLLEECNLKWLEYLNYDFFSIVVEDFERFANKLLIKRLESQFNIGITLRNFYLEPDQKLMWNMLNWANPGCVGKQNAFAEVDNRNLRNFRNNYRFWWFRLTWNFCDSFKRPSREEMDHYERDISEWAEKYSLEPSYERKSNTGKKREKNKKDPKHKESKKSEKAVEDVKPDKGKKRKLKAEVEAVPLEKYVKLPSMDENPIVNSIKEIMNSYTMPVSNKILPGPSTSRSESEEFLVNLIRGTSETVVREYTDDDINRLLRDTDAALQD